MRLGSLIAVASLTGLLAAPVHAQEAPPASPPANPPAKKKPAKVEKEVDPNLEKARELFAKGTTLVQAAQWAEALAAFEESAKLRPHPITTYNMGACERALGRYTVAQATLLEALQPPTNPESTLPESLVGEAKAYLAEIDRLLVHIDLTVAPADAEIAVDGRPLLLADLPDGRKLLVAGRLPAGRGQALATTNMELLLDPGTHLFTLSRKGFSDQVVTKTFEPGKHDVLELNLDKLPAKLRVSSNELRSIVRIDLADVGYAPVDINRPAGAYKVRVEKNGFVAYETTVKVNPGEEADIKATLAVERTPVTKKWWFWTAAGVFVTGTVVATYLATRSEPAPQRPPLDGGGLGWTLEVQ